MLRYAVGSIVSRHLTNPFPVGTFSINIIGSFIIGLLFGLVARNQWLQEGGMLLLASGFCGGFTTFSTFALENVNLMQKGQSTIALIYTGLSIVASAAPLPGGHMVGGNSNVNDSFVYKQGYIVIE